MTRRPRRWLTALHRAGYVCTALVALVVGYQTLYRFSGEYREMRAKMAGSKLETAVREGPMPEWSWWYTDDVERKLSPTLNQIRPDGIRFTAEPSFDSVNYAVAIWLPRGAAYAEGRFLASPRTMRAERRYGFRIPRADYLDAMREIDRLTHGYDGDYFTAVDGTPISFERVNGARVTSGAGNLDGPYDRVGGIVWELVDRFGNNPALPSERDWHDESS